MILLMIFIVFIRRWYVVVPWIPSGFSSSDVIFCLMSIIGLYYFARNTRSSLYGNRLVLRSWRLWHGQSCILTDLSWKKASVREATVMAFRILNDGLAKMIRLRLIYKRGWNPTFRNIDVHMQGDNDNQSFFDSPIASNETNTHSIFLRTNCFVAL